MGLGTLSGEKPMPQRPLAWGWACQSGRPAGSVASGRLPATMEPTLSAPGRVAALGDGHTQTECS